MPGIDPSTPEPKAPVVPEQGTPGSGGVPAVKPQETTPAATPASGTPPAAPSGGGDLQAELRKTQADINKLKSSYDRAQNEWRQRESEWKQRETEYQDNLRRFQTANMTEEELRTFQATQATEDNQRLARENQQLSIQLQERAIREDYISTAAQYGIPKDMLILDQGLEELASSVWAALWTRFEDLKSKAENASGTSPSAPKEPPAAPPVVSSTGSPASGMDWESLRKRYGSDEAIYSLIEQGLLDPSVLPKPPT